jgi:hypothetical protein
MPQLNEEYLLYKICFEIAESWLTTFDRVDLKERFHDLLAAARYAWGKVRGEAWLR